MADTTKKRIDNYRLIQKLGEGSFGEVYLAEHVHRKKSFAIKVLRARLSNETLADFLNEARAFRLDHPNIMHIRDFGVEQEIPFLVMDYVSGGTLRHRHPFGSVVPLDTVVSYVEQISEALQYAHDEGLVHRDVKPENMLIGPMDEILLSDFGIVTTSYTWNPANAQGVAGTALYMAPEQIQARPVRASDQYALAAIAYEWLSGTPPFRGTVSELVVQHLSVAPRSLCERVPLLSMEVNAVIQRGLAKDSRLRFASIREFAIALREASKPPIGTTQNVFSEHSDWITTLAWSPSGDSLASGSNDRTVRVWDVVSSQAIYTYYGHSREITSLAWSPDGMHIASASCDKTVHVWEATSGKKVCVYSQHRDDVLSIGWSPDGSSIASAGCDKTVHIWEASSGHKRHTYHGHADDIYSISWSPDGRYLSTASYDQTVQIREAATGNSIASYHNHHGSVYAVAWSPDGERVASASYDQTVKVQSRETGAVLQSYAGHSGGVFALVWSPDGTRIASGGDDGTVQVWNSVTGQAVYSYRLHEAGIRALAWAPGGQVIASGGMDKKVHIWQAM